jgi:hypothetical protein
MDVLLALVDYNINNGTSMVLAGPSYERVAICTQNILTYVSVAVGVDWAVSLRTYWESYIQLLQFHFPEGSATQSEKVFDLTWLPGIGSPALATK